jgi:hypothetical protein
MKNFTTKELLFVKHCVIVGSLVQKQKNKKQKTKSLATIWEVEITILLVV